MILVISNKWTNKPTVKVNVASHITIECVERYRRKLPKVSVQHRRTRRQISNVDRMFQRLIGTENFWLSNYRWKQYKFEVINQYITDTY